MDTIGVRFETPLRPNATYALSRFSRSRQAKPAIRHDDTAVWPKETTPCKCRSSGCAIVTCLWTRRRRTLIAVSAAVVGHLVSYLPSKFFAKNLSCLRPPQSIDVFDHGLKAPPAYSQSNGSFSAGQS